MEPCLDILLHYVFYSLGQILSWIQYRYLQVSCVMEHGLKSLKTVSEMPYSVTLNISLGTLNESVLSFLCRVLLTRGILD